MNTPTSWLERPILVFPSLYVPSLTTAPPAADLQVGAVMPLSTALQTGWGTEASFACYLLPPEVEPRHQPRLNKVKGRQALSWLAAQGLVPRMHWLAFDLDTPGHVPWHLDVSQVRGESEDADKAREAIRKAREKHGGSLEGWWSGVLQAIRSTPEGARAAIYRSNCGARLLWALEEPVDPQAWEQRAKEIRGRLRTAGAPVDELSDWTRLMRLPRVVLQSGVDLRSTTVDLHQAQPIRLVQTSDVPRKGGDEDLHGIFGSSGSSGSSGVSPSHLRLVSPSPDQAPADPAQSGDDWSRLRPNFPEHLRQVLRSGLPLAPPPEQRAPGAEGRNQALVRVVGTVLAFMDRPDADAAYRLIEPSVRAMDCADASLDHLRARCDEFASVEREKQRKVREDLAALGVYRRGQSQANALPAVPQADPLSLVVQTAQDADLTTRLIIMDSTGRAVWVWDETDQAYRGPFTRTNAAKALLQYCPTLASPLLQGQRGAYRPIEHVVMDCGRIARSVHLVLGAEQTVWDSERSRLLGAAARFARLEPAWDEEVHAWLVALGGDHGEQWLDWLATIRQVQRPTCAVYLHGEADAGKSFLVACLAQLWESETVVAYDVATGGGFNEELAESALIWADEELPEDHRGQTSTKAFRRYTGNTRHVLRRRFMPGLPIQGAYRTIITANNDELFKVENERLGAQDLRAVIERIGYMRSHWAPGEALARAGGWAATARWLEEKTVARHVLALEQDRTVVPGQRYLVPGWKTAFHEAMLSRAGINRQVLTLLAKALGGLVDRSWQGTGIDARDNHLWVNGPSVLKHWKTFLPDQRVPAEHEVSAALKQLSDPLEDGSLRRNVSIRGTQYNCWSIRWSEVLRYADDLQLGDAEKMLLKIRGA